jgi:hypothetical protein
VKQLGGQTVIAGAQHGIHQRIRLRIPGRPYWLEAVARVEASEQLDVQPFTGDD